MKKVALSLSFVLASLLGASAFAQGVPTPGEDKAVSVPAATKSEKAAAKQARKAEGKGVAKAGSKETEDKAAKVASATKEEKKAAKAARKSAGKNISKKQAKSADSTQ